MYCNQIALTLALLALAPAADAKEFSAARAFDYTRKLVAFGPRPPGSAAMKQQQAFILVELKQRGCEITQDDFTAQTPNGAVAMKNIICRFKGKSGRAVAISGHYDTKIFKFRFVGADDGGSSAGLLLELAQALSGRVLKDDVYLVFLDGEEAFKDWTATDSLYGSRHLSERWSRDGTQARMKALINVDMIGDKNLGIMQEMNSTPWLRQLVWKTAQDMGYGKYFLDTGNATEDDHLPFLKRGFAALDLIDFDYPPWHTAEDTMDKLSSHSFGVVGEVLLRVVQVLEARP